MNTLLQNSRADPGLVSQIPVYRKARTLVLALTLVILAAYQFLTLTQAVVLMLAMLVPVLALYPQLFILALGGFLVGVFSDLTLNYLAHLKSSTNVRWEFMRVYFERAGHAEAAVFAGCLTAWMILDVAVLANGLDPAVGFGVGAVWGVASQYALAFKDLLPFYENTPYGYLENRGWDGASTAFASGVLLLLGFR